MIKAERTVKARRTARGGDWIAVGVAGAAVMLNAGQVAAQVLEIGDNGHVTVYDRPAVFDANGSTPIQTPHAPRALAMASDTRAMVTNAAQSAELSPALVEAVAWRESHMRAGLVSAAGAVGEMQLMPGTARDLRVDPYDSQQNINGGAVYLSRMIRRYDGDLIRGLAAYNAGPGAVDRYGGVPPFRETRDYVTSIMTRLSQWAEPTTGEGRK